MRTAEYNLDTKKAISQTWIFHRPGAVISQNSTKNSAWSIKKARLETAPGLIRPVLKTIIRLLLTTPL